MEALTQQVLLPGAGQPVEPGTSRRRPVGAVAAAAVYVGLPTVVGLVHVAVVSSRYFVGSFDDDASYVLAARALATGHGLTALLPSGAAVAGAYPPGYPALLAPLVWLWPHSFVPLRVLSVVCFALLFPLTWWYLSERGLGRGARVAVLWLLALNPVLATYGSMVMAEAPFLVGFLVLLLLVDRWDRLPPPGRLSSGGARRRARWATGVAVVAVAGVEVWLKEAAIGMVAGLAVWQAVQRRWWRAAAVVGGTVALLVPVAVARVVSGIPLAGSRYSQELGGYYAGGLAGRFVHVLPTAFEQMVRTALPATIVPYLSPLPGLGAWSDLWKVVSIHVTVLVVIGAVRWWRRHGPAAVLISGVYLVETLFWPFINERRVVLVLPVVVAWYVLGAGVVWRWVRARLPGAQGWRSLGWSGGAAAVVAAAVAMPLAFQFPRDYLYALHQDSSRPGGSRYMAILAHLGTPADVVETDYPSTTALFSGHRTANTAFIVNLAQCSLPASELALAADHAGFLLLGDVNKPGLIDSPCLLTMANTEPWAVRLLHTGRDDASVFELIGPGTGHPELRDLIPGATATVSGIPLDVAGLVPRSSDQSAGGQGATLDAAGGGWLGWSWGAPQPVTQVSLDAASAAGGTSSVALQLDEPGRGWVTVTAAPRAVGDGAGRAPYLLAALPAATRASGVRVVVDGTGVARASGLQVLGPEGGR